MALTLTAVAGTRIKVSNKTQVAYDVTFDNSYTTGGLSLKASDVGLKKIDRVEPHGAFRKSDASDAVFVSHDYTNSKLIAYRQKDPAAAGGADIALPQVGNGADLSAYSGRITIQGF